MAQDETSPLMGGNANPNARLYLGQPGEATPLLSDSASTPLYAGTADTTSDVASIGSRRSRESRLKQKDSRCISFITMLILIIVVAATMTTAFIMPSAVEEYAKEAAVVQPTDLSIQKITTHGVQTRVQGNFKLDGSRVKDGRMRALWGAMAWVAREVGCDYTEVKAYLPDHGNSLLGTAVIPPLSFKLMDGEATAFDFVAEIRPGNAESYRTILNQWLDGKLDELRIEARANVSVRSGFVPLGTHAVSELMRFEVEKVVPSVPEYNISRLEIHDVSVPDREGMQLEADVAVTTFNKYPISMLVPEVGFELLVPSCHPDEKILVATALTKPVDVGAKSEVELEARGLVRELPKSLMRNCPNSGASPLDMFFERYIHGREATVYVRGGKQSSIPAWVGDIFSSITVPVPFPGRSFDSLLKEFSLRDVHFTLPDPFAGPDDPNSNPKVSGTILATAAIPPGVNFGLNVTSIRALSDVFYHGDKFGELNVDVWQQANSTMSEASGDHGPELFVVSAIKDAPLNITDGNVFSEVVQEVLFGDDQLLLDIDAAVDIRVDTVLGQLVLKGVPAQGKIPVKHLPGGSFHSLNPEVGSIQVMNTTQNSVTIQALVNVTNPTPYTALIPYINIHILCNDSIVGEATARNMRVAIGPNLNMVVEATWDPTEGGDGGPQVGRDLISQYISGWETNVTARAHVNSVPSAPILGEALSRINFTVTAPRLKLPGETGQDTGHFIRDATFHIFSSTATLTLVSPLKHDTLYITSVNATAFYNHTSPVGRIMHQVPFPAPPGANETPKLPVEWNPGGTGYDAIRKALGRNLKLDAFGIVGVRIGEWEETIWYEGKGLGAHIKL